jgi:hypothetical protein
LRYEIYEIIRAYRLAEEEPLVSLTAVAGQKFQLVMVFNAFCNGLHVHMPRHCDNGFDNRGVAGFMRDIPDEAAVDLDGVDRKFLQITQ